MLNQDDITKAMLKIAEVSTAIYLESPNQQMLGNLSRHLVATSAMLRGQPSETQDVNFAIWLEDDDEAN